MYTQKSVDALLETEWYFIIKHRGLMEILIFYARSEENTFFIALCT